ncbi:hypothetical protein A3A35_03470 [Candidatus Kaiserbacteria bacterium RIFCSPLOWO2_01_FULL_51_21]|uniref:Uncharacterized protein n=1 Tax=Candidatus Kaiserbacteria bacterium RIFCSPLOWO2_01_FULL_51_21 TaxID=1798508 RepID=A0A1F6ECC1_9BACT|nr:MAG: hypothetical protein A3A35_03470 [Candidatus Kaiserbacteria bacterium RIFCSPLOWO2_01_FULL_51_21]
MKYLSKVGFGVAMAVTPLTAFAVSNLQGLIDLLKGLLQGIGGLIIGLAFVAFFWGLAKFIMNADDETARSEGKRFMIWGIIALFVIISIMAILGVLNNTFFGSGVNLQGTTDYGGFDWGGTGGSVPVPPLPSGDMRSI